MDIGRIGGQPLVTAKLYIESGDDSRERGIRIREGWNGFLNSAGIGDRVRVVQGGDRRQILERLVKSATPPQRDIVPLVLVDSEQALAEGQTVWQHLKECYGCDRTRSSTDDLKVLAVPSPDSAYAHLTTDLADMIVSRLNVALGRRQQCSEEPGDAKTLHDASQPEEVIAMLRRSGRPGVADRLGYLRQLEHEDEDLDDLPLALDSLRQLARFLMDERWLPEPEIGVTPDGLTHAEWRFPENPTDTAGNGLLVMEFLCSGRVRFAAIANETESRQEVSRIYGTLSPVEMLRAVRPLTDQLIPR